MSTSLLEEVSEDFLNEDEGEVVLIEINAKKGTKGLYIGSNTSYRDEHEFLLPRDSEFKVVEVIDDYSWYPKIVVEAVWFLRK